MASKSGIASMAKLLMVAYPNYKPNEELLNLLLSTLSEFSDETVVAAAKKVIETERHSPRPADLRIACNTVKADRARTLGASFNPNAIQYVDYHDRPKWERDEIDVAKLEFHRVWTALENGAKIEDIFPYDSEPCKFARQIRERDAKEAEEQRKRVN